MIWDSSAVTAVGPGTSPESGLRLRPSAPNPFSAHTSITFDLPRTVPVSLAIFDLGGRRVKTLLSNFSLAPGPHSYDWNGRDDGGPRVEAGLYFCRLDAGAERRTTRIVFTK